jgi:FeS assembly SUF system protein
MSALPSFTPDAALPEEQRVRIESDDAALTERVIDAIRTIFDPEIPVNIWELGLIYVVQIHDGMVNVEMSLTAPACPVAGTLPGEVESRILVVQGVQHAVVTLVWEPAWAQDRMSDEARLELGLF